MLKIVRREAKLPHTELAAKTADFICDSEESLKESYRKVLNEAGERNIKSIALPLMPLKDSDYPREEGMRIALDEINLFFESNKTDVFLVTQEPGKHRSESGLRDKLKDYIFRNFLCSPTEELSWDHEMDCCDSVEPLPGIAAPRASLIGADYSREKKSGLFKREKLSAPKEVDIIGNRHEEAEENFDEIHDEMCMPIEMECSSIDGSFEVEELERKLKERMAHRSDTFTQYLMYLIESKGLSNADVYKRAIVTKQVFSSMKKDVNYHPTKSTALRFCIGAQLNLDESRDLLARAGYALSPCDKTDIIFSFFIENEHYDLIDIDIQLEEYGEHCIIS